uniref:DNA helicase n=1 Tax=Culicoides sonorensis TaxID=179676 RepID=A0A336MQU6_CULSO
MEGFDDAGIFFSDNFAGDDQQGEQINLQAVKKKYKDFIRTFNEDNFHFKYRDSLKRNYLLGRYYLEVQLEDLAGFDENLADKLHKQPTEHLEIFEEAAREVVDEITAPRPEAEEHIPDIQVLVNSTANPTNIRDLKSEYVSKLVKVAGIIVAASGIKAKANKITIQCRSCGNVIPNLNVNPGLEGYPLPRKCNTEQAGRPKCPLDPFFILPDKCKCMDFQVLKLQELPDFIPQGEIPRHMTMFCDRSLCERVVPGNRVLMHGIFSIRKVGKPSKADGKEKATVGVRSPYMRVVGITVDSEGVGAISRYNHITTEEESQFRKLAATPNLLDVLAESLAPSIFGSTDIKKAIVCLLFGGARKRMPDGLTRRGDINLLLLGDPGTAKSQLLKFVEKVAPIAVYTSGKGSSASGLTASVMRDPASRNFIMEGGAMVLADGGVVCIDEFDKMKEDDRVAIHEAMEQQTISIAKAGITTTLNTRCSVLAAANSIFGRLEGYPLPRKCNTEQAGRPKCPLDPFFILPDKCKCMDFQVLKLQELPDFIPQGEIPRHMTMFCDRSLCERVVPGNRVLMHGIFSIRKVGKPSKADGKEKATVGVRSPYMRVVGITVDSEGVGAISRYNHITTEEESQFRKLAATPNLLDVLAESLAPSIFGSTDIKKAIVCLLFGGARKRMPDGLTRRGDINLLLLGDPGTAKSQLLKFVEKVAPIAVYTSGKGSSASGLTASVMRDPASRNFIMEGGAMVLADGGVVCIDEFDKMKEDDRVAIHEAMEQQTISIAKAGITTTLNTRCSVLAAANSIFGRWDDTKGEENIDFMPTILSRFDMIFIVKDLHDESRDITLAKHIINVHLNANRPGMEAKEGEISLATFKKFIHYCRTHCGPRLTKEAGDKLKSRYVLMRTGQHDQEKAADKRLAIPITVRQLEAIIRIAESLAKMQLQPFANESHVNEALRLFQVSTLDAAMSGSLAGAEGFTTEEDQEMLNRIEKQLKRRFAIGSQVSEQNIIQDFTRQKYPERAVLKVIHTMIRRGELQHRMQRKMLYRLC